MATDQWHSSRMHIAAVLGASAVRAKFGNKAVRAFREVGWTVYPVHPRELEIEGIACIPNVSAIAAAPDVISVYLPPSVLLGELQAIAQKGCGELWLNPGTDTTEVISEASRLGLRVVRDCTLLRLGKRPDEFD